MSGSNVLIVLIALGSLINPKPLLAETIGHADYLLRCSAFFRIISIYDPDTILFADVTAFQSFEQFALSANIHLEAMQGRRITDEEINNKIRKQADTLEAMHRSDKNISLFLPFCYGWMVKIAKMPQSSLEATFGLGLTAPSDDDFNEAYREISERSWKVSRNAVSKWARRGYPQ